MNAHAACETVAVEQRTRLYVTLEGYAVEGGFDRPYEPATCYSPTIALGRHFGPGAAEGLWSDYEQVLEFVPQLGFDGIRLSVEWARLEPRRGQFDFEAHERYARVVRYAQSMDLGVTIALVDASWPAWLGLEAWLLPWVVPVVLEHARTVVTHLAEPATGVVVFADPRALVTGGYLEGTVPPWRRGADVEAAMAGAQIDSILAALASDPVVGPRIVTSTRTVSLDVPLAQIARARANSVDCDELYARTLVRGSGPTRAPTGLLVKRDDQWRIEASEGLVDVLR
jgi:beta-glucosidase/6-phospho-beta-glucosidase/beta-galactosidase